MGQYGRLCASAAVALMGTSSNSLAQGHGHPHVHGVASLQAVVDGAAVTLVLRTPLENVVGFEHAPRTEQQKKAMRDAQESLRNPQAQFAFTAAARCDVSSMKVESPFAANGEPSGGKMGGKPQGGEAHAELTARYAFRCQHPDRLKSVEVKLFDRFRNLRRVDVELAGPRGQKAYRLTSKQRVVDW